MFSNISHELTHDHEGETVIHTVEAEQDECHRSLYHAAQNNGCNHREHFIPSTSSCELCDAFIRPFQLAGDKNFISTAEFLLELIEAEVSIHHPHSHLRETKPRAPPFS